MVKSRKLGRNTPHRMSMLRNLASSLFEHGTISTTLGRAKELRSFAEKMITIAKTKDKLNAIRLLKSKLYTKVAIQKCIEMAEKDFKERNGGYTRVVKNGFRYGDCAPVGVIQFVLESKTKKQSSKIS